MPTIAQAIGLSFSGGAEPKEQLLGYLRRKNVLFVLDNYEHLLQGAGLVTEILRGASEVKALVTSRSGLHVQGEYRFPVSGMSYPGAAATKEVLQTKDALQYSAIRLFTASALRAQPNLDLTGKALADVVRICQLVDGIPLAIMLAAAWIEMLTPAEIAAEIERSLDVLETDLRDAPERQRSMRAVFEHSWSLLSEGQRAVMQALSVFRGGFTREAAQEVAGASLRDLMSLVDRSLLYRAPTGRYEVHELLRQYAAEKLERSPGGNGAVRDRHAATYAAALEGWAADLKGPRQLAAMAEIQADVDNVRAAWAWAIERDQVDWLDRALEGMCMFYEWGSHAAEGEAACRKAADRLDAPSTHRQAGSVSGNRLRVLAHALAWQGVFSETLGSEAVDRCFERALAALDRADSSDPAPDVRRERAFILGHMTVRLWSIDSGKARQSAERSLELYRTLGDRRGMAEARMALGMAIFGQGALESAKQLFEDSLSLLRAQGDRRAMIWPLIWSSWTCGWLGQTEEGERAARESVAIAHQVGDRFMIEWATRTLCDAYLYSGRFAEAQSLREENLAFSHEQGARGYEAPGMRGIALDAMHLGSYEEARTVARAVLTMSRESGRQDLTADVCEDLGRLALAERAYRTAQEWLRQSVTIYQQSGAYGSEGSALAGLVYAARGLGQAAQARGHLSAALRTVVETRQWMTALDSLPAAALLLMDGGEVERAVELYALAFRHGRVANSRWFEDVAGKHIAVAATTLPPEVVATAQERGRARDLWATMEDLLAELEANP